MSSSEPEIVTRAVVRLMKEQQNQLPHILTTTVSRLCNTIELFAGLLEESCWLGCDEDDGDLCESCQRKAAALRRYRGE